MKLSPLSLYVSAAVFQTAGSSGAAMLAPFFMKEHGYSVAMVGIPLVANGVGRVCSDVMSGVMATYFSPGPLLIIAMIVGLITSIVGYAFIGAMPVFMGAWIVFGLTEAMFALSLRKIGFDQSEPGQQGRVQGQMAAALGIGFTIGPLLGGFVGKWLGPDGLFFLYGAPQTIGMILIFLAGGHRYRRATVQPSAEYLARGKPAFAQTAVSRVLSGDLPILPVFGRRDPRRVSIPRRESSRHQFRNRRHHGLAVALDRHLRALCRRLALRSDQTRVG